MVRKLFASDIDGTLIPEESTVIPDPVYRAVEAAWDAGCLFVAASGRQYPSLRALFEPVVDKMAFLIENGSGLYYQDRLVYARAFDRELAIEIAKFVQATPNCEFLADGEGKSCVIPKDRDAFLHQLTEVQKLEVRELSDFDQFPDRVMKIAVWCTDGAACHSEAFQAAFGHCSKIAVSGKSWIDFSASDKGSGLAAACGYFGVARADTVAFGDNWNDVPMLDFAARPYLVETANPQLLDRYPDHISDVPSEIRRILKNL